MFRDDAFNPDLSPVKIGKVQKLGIDNLNEYLESAKPISETRNYEKLRFITELYAQDAKNSGDVQDMQDVVEKFFMKVEAKVGVKRTDNCDVEFYDNNEILRLMGEALNPILMHALGDKFKTVNVSNKTNNDTMDLEFLESLKGEVKKNYIDQNKKAVMTSKSVLERLQKKNEDLLSQNIPMLQNTTGFSRQDLYSFFILFKALCQITSQRYVQEKKGKFWLFWGVFDPKF